MEIEETTTLERRVARLSPQELDRFFAHISLDLEADPRQAESHWLFDSRRFGLKKRRTGEQTPMMRLDDGHYYSAQRLSLILFMRPDPLFKRRIRTECGLWHCVNPYHLTVKPCKRRRRRQ